MAATALVGYQGCVHAFVLAYESNDVPTGAEVRHALGVGLYTIGTQRVQYTACTVKWLWVNVSCTGKLMSPNFVKIVLLSHGLVTQLGRGTNY